MRAITPSAGRTCFAKAFLTLVLVTPAAFLILAAQVIGNCRRPACNFDDAGGRIHTPTAHQRVR